MKLAITRPKEDALPLAGLLAARGHHTVIASLLEIVPRPGIIWPGQPFQAVAVTSANGVRHLKGRIAMASPVFAVGAQSAAAARARGFANVMAVGGNVHGLAQHILKSLRPFDGAILYISGAETSGDLEGQLQKAGFSVMRLVTYDAVSQKLDAIALELQSCQGVLLYSPRTTKLWLQEMQRLGLSSLLRHMTHYCLSPQIADILPPGMPRKIAASPAETDLLALLEFEGKAE